MTVTRNLFRGVFLSPLFSLPFLPLSFSFVVKHGPANPAIQSLGSNVSSLNGVRAGGDTTRTKFWCITHRARGTYTSGVALYIFYSVNMCYCHVVNSYLLTYKCPISVKQNLKIGITPNNFFLNFIHVITALLFFSPCCFGKTICSS